MKIFPPTETFFLNTQQKYSVYQKQDLEILEYIIMSWSYPANILNGILKICIRHNTCDLKFLQSDKLFVKFCVYWCSTVGEKIIAFMCQISINVIFYLSVDFNELIYLEHQHRMNDRGNSAPGIILSLRWNQQWLFTPTYIVISV